MSSRHRHPLLTQAPFSSLRLLPAPPRLLARVFPSLPRTHASPRCTRIGRNSLRRIRLVSERNSTGCGYLLDRLNFELVVDGIRKDDSVEEIYRTHVALGDMHSPTPEAGSSSITSIVTTTWSILTHKGTAFPPVQWVLRSPLSMRRTRKMRSDIANWGCTASRLRQSQPGDAYPRRRSARSPPVASGFLTHAD